jgi:hypothetical protein
LHPVRLGLLCEQQKGGDTLFASTKHPAANFSERNDLAEFPSELAGTVSTGSELFPYGSSTVQFDL